MESSTNISKKGLAARQHVTESGSHRQSLSGHAKLWMSTLAEMETWRCGDARNIGQLAKKPTQRACMKGRAYALWAAGIRSHVRMPCGLGPNMELQNLTCGFQGFGLSVIKDSFLCPPFLLFWNIYVTLLYIGSVQFFASLFRGIKPMLPCVSEKTLGFI